MARIIAQSLPPSMLQWYRHAMAFPRLTGFDIFVGSYPYAQGFALSKRIPFHFPPRQGFTAPTLSAIAIANRWYWKHAIAIFALQPYAQSFTPTYGQRGRNFWSDEAAPSYPSYFNYFMSCQIYYSRESLFSPWDTHAYVAISAGDPGDESGYAWSAPLPAGTYRITMLPSLWVNDSPPPKHLIASDVRKKTAAGSESDIGILGKLGTPTQFRYADPPDWSDFPDGAWTRYITDAEYTFFDLPLDTGDALGIQYLNELGTPEGQHFNSLEASITRL